MYFLFPLYYNINLPFKQSHAQGGEALLPAWASEFFGGQKL